MDLREVVARMGVPKEKMSAAGVTIADPGVPDE